MKQLAIFIFMFGAIAAQAQGTWNAPVQSNTVKRTFQWSYGRYRFTQTIDLNVHAYQYYKSLSKRRPNQEFAAEHASYPYFVQLAATLDVDARQLRFTGWDLVGYLTAFVQQAIPYVNDPYNDGWDYPKYPIETLFEQGGDCEDVAALLVVLLTTFGFDAVLVSLPGHMAAAVECSYGKCGSGYYHNGKRYSFIEATSDNKIGYMPSNYASTTPQVLEVKRTANYQRPALPDYVQPVVVAPSPYRPTPSPQPTISPNPWNPTPIPTVVPCTCPPPTPIDPWGNGGGRYIPAPPVQPYYVPNPRYQRIFR